MYTHDTILALRQNGVNPVPSNIARLAHRLQPRPGGSTSAAVKTSSQQGVIQYNGESLLSLRPNSTRIPRNVRKRLFDLNLWLPSKMRNQGKNRGSDPNVLRSLPKVDLRKPQSKQFHMAYVNAYSIRNKTDDILQHVSDAN